MWQAIAKQLSEELMFNFEIDEKELLSGGDISDCYMITDGFQRYFVKTNERSFGTKFEIESKMIQQLRNTNTVRVPEYVMNGQTKDKAFLILNYLPTKPLDDAKGSYKFGQQLAELHQFGEQAEYGYDFDNFIGSTLQPNKWQKKWHIFFAEQRIGWQLQLLREKGTELTNIHDFVEHIKYLLIGHHPKPSLLHGDLWHGNVASSPFGPICYDPASYWGDRECDIAMTELFEGFQPEFYQGYESVLPLDFGYQQRKDIYNLYHLMNHYNQFGGHYLGEVEQLVEKIQEF